jgi:hypothetical protein
MEVIPNPDTITPIPDTMIEKTQELYKEMEDFQRRILANVAPENVDMQASVLGVGIYMLAVTSMHFYGLINPGQIIEAAKGAIQQMQHNFEQEPDTGDRSKTLN